MTQPEPAQVRFDAAIAQWWQHTSDADADHTVVGCGTYQPTEGRPPLPKRQPQHALNEQLDAVLRTSLLTQLERTDEYQAAIGAEMARLLVEYDSATHGNLSTAVLYAMRREAKYRVMLMLRSELLTAMPEHRVDTARRG